MIKNFVNFGGGRDHCPQPMLELRQGALMRKDASECLWCGCLVEQKTLDVALDPKNEGTRPVDFTDRLAMLGILGNNRWARDSIWPYVRDNWDDLAKRYDSRYPLASMPTFPVKLNAFLLIHQ